MTPPPLRGTSPFEWGGTRNHCLPIQMRPLQKVLAWWEIDDSEEASDGGSDEARSGRSARACRGVYGQGAGQQRATGEDRRTGRLVAVRAVAVASAARRERATAVSGAGDVQGV